MTISLDSGGGYTGVSWKGSSETSIHNIINTSACTFYAPLKSSLILSKGTGDPTWSRATKAWGFNELGYLEELATDCAYFGGARLVRNQVSTSSENITSGGKTAVTTPDATTVLCDVGNTFHYLFRGASGGAAIVGHTYLFKFRVQYVNHKVIQFFFPNTFFSSKYANFDLETGDLNNVSLDYINVVNVSTGVWDVSYTGTVISAGTPSGIIGFVTNISSSRLSNYNAAGTEEFKILRVQIENISSRPGQLNNEYVSVGVEASPYFGAGIDGAKYFETDWQGAPIAAANLLGFRREAAATNNLLHSRDLSNAAWSTKTNITAAKTATGLDGIANTATTLTATAADAIILQPITLASAARCASAYVKRRTGTGTISFTQDGGSTWTDITAQINSSTWSRVQITSTLANPSTGFKISTSGDAVDVDCIQSEAGAGATSPIVTTTATVTRNQDSLTYQLLSNLDDIAGTISVITQPLVWTSGGAVGSVSNGLLLSAANSGVVGNDGTNTANGPAGSPTGTEKLALRWGGGAMTAASGGTLGTPGTYDGSLSLANIGIGVGSYGYFNNVAIFNYTMTDAEQQAITT